MLACRLLDVTETCSMRIDRVIGLKFPAYLVPHPHKVIWLLHQHRTAYELWDHPAAGDLIHYPDGPVVREAIRQADRIFIPEAKAIYTLSRNVSGGLRRSPGIDAEPCTILRLTLRCSTKAPPRIISSSPAASIR